MHSEPHPYVKRQGLLFLLFVCTQQKMRRFYNSAVVAISHKPAISRQPDIPYIIRKNAPHRTPPFSPCALLPLSNQNDTGCKAFSLWLSRMDCAGARTASPFRIHWDAAAPFLALRILPVSIRKSHRRNFPAFRPHAKNGPARSRFSRVLIWRSAPGKHVYSS